MDVTTKVVQIFGGYDYTKEYPVERMMIDANITEINIISPCKLSTLYDKLNP